MTPEEFAAMLREYREKHGLTQRELARLLGVSQGSIRAWERLSKAPELLAMRGCIETLTNGTRFHEAAHALTWGTIQAIRVALGSTTIDFSDAVGMTRQSLQGRQSQYSGPKYFASKVGMFAEIEDYKRHIKEALEWDDSYAYIENTTDNESTHDTPRAPSEPTADGGSVFDFDSDLPEMGVREG